MIGAVVRLFRRSDSVALLKRAYFDIIVACFMAAGPISSFGVEPPRRSVRGFSFAQVFGKHMFVAR